MKIGFIGLGVMGSNMLRHLVAGGHTARVYDRDAGARERAAGGCVTAVESPREAAAGSEIVFTMLPDGEAVRDVALGENGLAEGFSDGGLLVDTSSAEPWVTQHTAAELAKKNIAMIDAPVSGAEEGAADARLVFMAGGDEAGLERAMPLLKLMGDRIFHLGPIGAGHAMKTINNLATALNIMGTVESLLIGKAYGLKADVMADVINVSTGYSFFTQQRLKPDVLSRRFADGFKLELMLKDMRIATTLAASLALETPFSSHGVDLWRKADEALGAGAPITELVRWYERTTGITLEDA